MKGAPRRRILTPMRAIALGLIPLLAPFTTACGGPAVNLDAAAARVVSEIPASGLKAVAERRIYFGHQSVGAEIVKGLGDLSSGTPEKLRVVEGAGSDALAEPGFCHSLNGENEKPLLKIDAFERTMDGPLSGQVDIAFFKFCYVDIRPDTDVSALFERYHAAMTALKERHPSVTFVHVTSPLTTVQPGWKVALKRLLRRPQSDYTANVKRAEYNELLVGSYSGREPLFDLAAAESTWPDGTRHTFSYEGKEWPALIDAYSYDGRHLAEGGRRWVAAHLLAELARIAD